MHYVVIFGEVLLQWFYKRFFGWPYIFQNIQSFTYMYEMLFFFFTRLYFPKVGKSSNITITCNWAWWNGWLGFEKPSKK
jgi:hypothetical protein